MRIFLSSPCFNADGGGAAAPIASPFTGGGAGNRRGPAQQGGEDHGHESDTAELLRQMQAEIRQANARASQASEKGSALENIIGGIKTAITGEGEPDPDWYEDQLVPYLAELEKQGKSHPMTATLARELKKAQEQNRQVMPLVEQLKAEIAQLKNPNFQNDERAYAVMDDAITEELTSVYGEASPTLHRAVAANIAADLARVQKELPGKWEEIRRDPQKLARIVRHHITQMIPPVAKQAIAKQVEDNTPVTLETLTQAWGEFQTIKHQLNPQQREEIATELRRRILSERYAQNRKIPVRR